MHYNNLLTPLRRLMMLTAVGVFLGCQSSDLDLYFVDHQEQEDFITLDIPKTIISMEGRDLTTRQLDAYESVEKLNILMFKSDSTNLDQLHTEVVALNTIFKDSKYEQLMKFGGFKEADVKLMINGDDDNALDEMVFFGYMPSTGMAVVRVLGDDMKLEDIMSLAPVIKNADLSSLDLEPIKAFFQ